MQNKPSGWDGTFSASHKTEYKFVIAGTTYLKEHIHGTPVIKKPFMDSLCIGRCCSGTLNLQIRPQGDIPRAAEVVAYCRLISSSSVATAWVEQGHYYISSRKKNGDLLDLTCRDSMAKASTSYLENTGFTEWPVSMSAVVSEIESIIGVSHDNRTTIKTGTDYVVSYPNDLLMSEVLAMIAAAHGGNFIITENNSLRLVALSSATNTSIINSAYSKYTPQSTSQIISRITLEDDAGNKFTAGDDTGAEITAKCTYATQNIVDELGFANLGSLYGIMYEPYNITGAYIDPCTEVGDKLQFKVKGGILTRYIGALNIRCNISNNADISCNADFDDEDEFPYISARDLASSRYIRTDLKYYGNRIDRVNGFTSEYIINNKVTARLIANSNVFSMQRVVEDAWEDCIYFDAATQKYVITGSVTIKGVVTAESLSTPGQTAINGANITTGILKSKDGKVQLNLDTGEFTVGDKDLNTALTIAENRITLLASSQVFAKEAGATGYTPSSITLTAQTYGNIASYTWYRDNTLLTGSTSQTLTVTPADFSSQSATYKVIGKDSGGNTYTDYLTVTKLSDGEPGADGSPGTPGKDGVDGYTVVLSNEFVEVFVDAKRKPLNNTTFTSKVNVYKGLQALTPTLGTLSASYFKVNVVNSIPGVTVTQTIAGTITIEVSKDTAITDNAELALNITVYNGPTLSAKIIVQANMNNVTVEQQASIKLNADNIELKVSKNGVISAINQSAEEVTIDASKINLSGYVTISSLKNGATTINGSCITTGTIDASKVSVINLNASNIKSGTIDASKITVKNLSASAITTGTLDASKVSVTNLDASNITSGTISADRIDTSTLKAKKIYSSSNKISLMEYTSGSMYIGGDGTWNYDWVYIFASSYVKIGTWDGINSHSLIIDTENHSIHPSSVVDWDLGNISYPFGDLYCQAINIHYTGSDTIEIEGSSIFPKSGSPTLGKSSNPWQNAYVSNLFINGTKFDPSALSISSLIYSSSISASLNSSKQFIPAAAMGYYLGSSSYPWDYAYIKNLYINGTKFDPSALSISSLIYSSSVSASLNASKQFIPASSTGYYLGSSTYPWDYVYLKNLYINGTKFDPSSSGDGNFAGSQVTMGGSTSYYVVCDTSRYLRPNSSSTSYPFYLGTSSYPWHYAYIGSVSAMIGTSSSSYGGSKLGFFGTTPVVRQTLSTSTTNMSYTSATSSNYLTILNNLVGILKNKYGLIG